jgi:hypothetical protein
MSNAESREAYWEIVVVEPTMNRTNSHSLLTFTASQIMPFDP